MSPAKTLRSNPPPPPPPPPPTHTPPPPPPPPPPSPYILNVRSLRTRSQNR